MIRSRIYVLTRNEFRVSNAFCNFIIYTTNNTAYYDINNYYVRTLSSATTSSYQSFYGYTSRRSERKRRLLKRKQRLLAGIAKSKSSSSSSFDNDEIPIEKDTRTLADILWPNPWKEEEQIERAKRTPWYKHDWAYWKNEYAIWKKVYSMAMTTYRESWSGFFTSKGFIIEDEEDIRQRQQLQQQQKEDRDRIIAEETSKVTENITRNTKELMSDAEQLKQEIRDRTGIHTLEDLRRVTREMMQLATDCLNEFMSGYRKGRDDEIDKMLNEYFQQIEQQVTQKEADDKARAEKFKNRRKIKKRIINPYGRV